MEYGPRRDHWDARWRLHYDIVGFYTDNLAELPLVRGRDGLDRPPLTLISHDYFGQDLFVCGLEGVEYFQEAGVKRVVTCTSNVDRLKLPPGIEQRRFIINHALNVSDGQSRPISKKDFVKEMRAIREWLRGWSAAALCEHGWHRSTGVCCGLLLIQGYSLPAAADLIEYLRPRADLSHDSYSKRTGKRRRAMRTRLQSYASCLNFTATQESAVVHLTRKRPVVELVPTTVTSSCFSFYCMTTTYNRCSTIETFSTKFLMFARLISEDSPDVFYYYHHHCH